MPSTNGSSVISETKRSNVSVRDGGLCVLCGDDPVYVAHIVAHDTGQISNEIEYVPIHRTRFRAFFHHPTCYDQTLFTFDTVDRAPCPDLHFQASPICLMIQAQPYLCSVVRLGSDRADVNTLLELYRRSPRVGCNNPIIAPAYRPVSAMQPYLNDNHPSAHVSPTRTSSRPPSHPTTSAPIPFGFDRHPEMPGFTPRSSTSTMDASDDTEAYPDLMDPQLIECTSNEITLSRSGGQSG